MLFDSFDLCMEVKSSMWNEKGRGQGIHHIAQESSKGIRHLAVSYFACKGVLPEFI